MNLPVMKISPATFALRIRENNWDALGIAIDNLVLDRDYSLDVPEFLRWLQAALTKRQGTIDDCSQEHSNIQQDVNILDVLILFMDRNHEHDGFITRAEKLERLQIAMAKLESVR